MRDNGTGIERAEQRAIYEQFKRGRAADETGAPGVGLGLAFVRTIVARPPRQARLRVASRAMTDVPHPAAARGASAARPRRAAGAGDRVMTAAS